MSSLSLLMYILEKLASQPHGSFAILLVPYYTAWWQKHKSMNNLLHRSSSRCCTQIGSYKYDTVITVTFNSQRYTTVSRPQHRGGNSRVRSPSQSRSQSGWWRRGTEIQTCSTSDETWSTTHTPWHVTDIDTHRVTDDISHTYWLWHNHCIPSSSSSTQRLQQLWVSC